MGDQPAAAAGEPGEFGLCLGPDGRRSGAGGRSLSTNHLVITQSLAAIPLAPSIANSDPETVPVLFTMVALTLCSGCGRRSPWRGGTPRLKRRRGAGLRVAKQGSRST